MHFLIELGTLIGSPFREDFSTVLHISKTEDVNVIQKKEVIMFKCRKAGEKIQERLQWTVIESEYVGLPEYNISIRCPKHFIDRCDRRCKYEKSCGNNILIPKEDIISKSSGGVLEYCFDLSVFEHVDDLLVRIDLYAKMNLSRFVTDGVNHPTKGGKFIIHYPEEWDIAVDYFGFPPDDVVIVQHSGFYSLSIDQWILPFSGIAAQLIPKNQTIREMGLPD